MSKAWILLAAGFPGAVWAVDEAPHDAISADIIVTAPFARDRGDVLSTTSVLQGTELTRDLRGTLGDTLARQPGVSSTSFGPNASRPVLRGFQGERIRVLLDGIGSFDVSNTSVDHAVAINPQLAERIEVIHGPASLLYGSSAIGGVVNVIDKRIPRAVPDEVVHLDLLGTYGSAADERSASGVLDVPIGGRFVAHLDGSYLKTDDLEIGGFVLSRPLRDAALASDAPEIRELASLRGRLPNSAARTWSVAGGLSYIDEGGELGVAVSHYESLYGVPIRFSLDPEAEAEAVRLDIEQTRVDARAGIDTGGFIERLNFRFGYADYEHAELEDTGEVGTRFFNQGLEARGELVQAERGGWKGASGVQYLHRRFDVIGEEAFIPRNETEQGGVFTLQELTLGALKLEGALRYERTNVTSNVGDFRGGEVRFDRDFNALSGSVGASFGLTEGWRVGGSVSRTVRAPSAEELLANGPHAGTQAFEIGDPTFRTERGVGGEIVLRGRGDGYRFEASGYYNRFSRYIYEQQTGDIEDDLPVFQYLQGRARYYGFEVSGEVTAARFGDWELKVDGLADYVNARLRDGGGPIPRIPPLRLLGGVALSGDRADLRVETEWADDQDRVAAFETQTRGYTLVNASVAVRPFTARPGIELVLSGTNLLDRDVRRHASFLKDFAPLAGRDLRLSLRVVL